jgi:hypothetical protein
MNHRFLPRLRCLALLIVVVGVTLGPTASAQGSYGTIERVSVKSDGSEGFADSYQPAITPDGRYVAFESDADYLVAGDTNNEQDILLHDRVTHQTTLVSVSSAGAQSNGESTTPVISNDGRYVAFYSLASNLVANDTNNSWDIFVRDRQTNTTTRVSVSSSGEQGNDHSFAPAISDDGRYVAFYGPASNLVLGDTNNKYDVFVHDRQTAQTTRVSVSSSGEQGNQAAWTSDISGDGRFVAFHTYASNLVAGDTNNTGDVFVHDRDTGQTTRVSVSSGGGQGNNTSDFPALSDDGRYVAFYSAASSLVADDNNSYADIFVHDRQTGQTTLVSANTAGVSANNMSTNPDITADGRYIVFESYATDLVTGDTGTPGSSMNVFVRDSNTAQTRRASVTAAGAKANGYAIQGAITDDGRYVAFSSDASNLVSNDTNEIYDVFVHDRDGVVGAPSVTGFSPTSGPVGTSVTISGANLGGATAVTFNGTNQPAFTVNGAGTQVTAAVPAGATTGPIAVTTPVATATSATNFTVTIAPSISSFTPTSGPVGTSVTINGANFSGATSVKFNGTNQPAFTVNPAGTQITAAVPAGATTGPLAVTTPGGTATSTSNFTVLAAPSITSFTPTSGPAGTSVIINGTNLTGATAVTFNGVNATVFTVNSATKITATVPNGATTGKIAVTTPGGTATSATDFTVTIVSTTAIYLSATGAGSVSGKAFTGADILSYVQATNTWDVLYDGSFVAKSKNVGAFAFQGNDILLGFSANQAIAGMGTFAAHDLARFTPASLGYNSTAGSFAWFFDGSDVGLSTAAEKLDALWLDSNGRLYISTTGSGVVPANSAQPAGAKVAFQDEDILRFTPSSTGATTAGTWTLYWDPTAMTGMTAEDINGYWENPATGHRYVTILGAFNVGNAVYGGTFSGNGTSILPFAPNAAAPGGWAPVEKVTWLAAGGTLPAKFAIDGIEMTRP